jgi:hypothetical protein
LLLLQEQMVVALVGRAAEREVLGEDNISTLTMDNIVYARACAHKMVMAAGMTEIPELGPRTGSLPSDNLNDSPSYFIGQETPYPQVVAVQQKYRDLLQWVRHFVTAGHPFNAFNTCGADMHCTAFCAGGTRHCVTGTGVPLQNISASAIDETTVQTSGAGAMQGEKEAIDLVTRNRTCIDKLAEVLNNPPFETLGVEVQEIVQQYANAEDLQNARQAVEVEKVM